MKQQIPHTDYELESLLIKSIIERPNLLGTLGLKEDHFFYEQHRIAYSTMAEMFKSGEGISMITLYGKFVDNGGVWSSLKALFRSHEAWETTGLFAQQYLNRLADLLARRRICEKFETLKNAPEEFIEEVKKIELEFVQDNMSTLFESAEKYQENYEKKKDRKEATGSVGVKTNWKWLNDNCPLEPESLHVLGARTSVGKSALALNIAVNAAHNGQKVLFFSAEMTENSLIDRVMAYITGIRTGAFKNAEADKEVMNISEVLYNIRALLKLKYKPDLTSELVSRIVRVENQKRKVDLVVVDYLQLLKDEKQQGDTETRRIGRAVSNLRDIACECKTSVLVLCQVSREAMKEPNGMPQLHHLRESGEIEQCAEVVLFLNRRDRGDTYASVRIAKNREGALDETTVTFNPSTTSFVF